MRRTFEGVIVISEDENELKNDCTKITERIKGNPLLPIEIKENSKLYHIIYQRLVALIKELYYNEDEENTVNPVSNIFYTGFTVHRMRKRKLRNKENL